MEKPISYKQFQSICRLCLKSDIFLKPLFPPISNDAEIKVDEWDEYCCVPDSSENPLYVEIVTNLTGIIMNPLDPLPKFACNSCLANLRHFAAFRDVCLNSFEMLEKIRLNVNVEDNDELEKMGDNDLLFEFQDFDNVMKCAKYAPFDEGENPASFDVKNCYSGNNCLGKMDELTEMDNVDLKKPYNEQHLLKVHNFRIYENYKNNRNISQFFKIKTVNSNLKSTDKTKGIKIIESSIRRTKEQFSLCCCKTCLKTFSQYSSLLNHILITHKRTAYRRTFNSHKPFGKHTRKKGVPTF